MKLSIIALGLLTILGVATTGCSRHETASFRSSTTHAYAHARQSRRLDDKNPYRRSAAFQRAIQGNGTN